MDALAALLLCHLDINVNSTVIRASAALHLLQDTNKSLCEGVEGCYRLLGRLCYRLLRRLLSAS